MSGKKVFLAVPAKDGRIECDLAKSLLHGVAQLTAAGYKTMPYFHERCPFPDEARNIIVELFRTLCFDELIMIDDDQGFQPDTLLKILEPDKDVVAAACPLKMDEGRFAVQIGYDEQDNCLDESTGLVRASALGTGIIRIRKNVFDEMIIHYMMQRTNQGLYSFFATGVHREYGNDWLGEDVYFSKRLLGMGKEMWIVPNLTITHTGAKTWRGNLQECILRLRVNK
jgi:hypothetical protein